MDDLLATLPDEFLRRDIRHPRLKPGERLVLAFHRVPQAGDILLVRRGDGFAVVLAPTDEDVVAVVRVLDAPAD